MSGSVLFVLCTRKHAGDVTHGPVDDFTLFHCSTVGGDETQRNAVMCQKSKKEEDCKLANKKYLINFSNVCNREGNALNTFIRPQGHTNICFH